VDLKGKDSVPESVHHVVVEVDPRSEGFVGLLGEEAVRGKKECVVTDEVHPSGGGEGGKEGDKGKVGCVGVSVGVCFGQVMVRERREKEGIDLERHYIHSLTLTLTHTHTHKPFKKTEQKSSLLKHTKPLALLKLIDTFQMSQCIIFCRTNLDCDLLESFLVSVGGGQKFRGKTEKGMYVCVCVCVCVCVHVCMYVNEMR
jgi:hypothetical protein